MKKKSGMLLTFLFIAALCYSQEKYIMLETMHITPKTGKSEDLKKGLNEHNTKWHAEGAYKVKMWEVIFGKHEGDFLWVMGPCTFTDLDTRPDDDAHNQDWEKKVGPYVEKYGQTNYWKINDKLSYLQEKSDYKMADITFYKVRAGQEYRFDEIFRKVVEVYKQKNYGYEMIFFESHFALGDAPEIVVLWHFDKWEWFDVDTGFKKMFEEVYGEGSWASLMKEYYEVVEYALDEVIKVME